MEYKSAEELHFSYYLDELKERCYIERYNYEPESMFLSGEVLTKRIRLLKTKIKQTEVALLREHIYTPDFVINWKDEADNIFHCLAVDAALPFIADIEGTEIISYVEIKPTWDMQNMSRIFKQHTQKWVYSQHGIYVNLIVPERLFKATFTPERFLLTDKNKSERKINYKVVKFDEFEKKAIEYKDKLNTLLWKKTKETNQSTTT